MHKIECARCRAITYVETVPYVYICPCFKPRKPGYKWLVCRNCGEGSEVEAVLTIDNQCKNCENKRSTKEIATYHEPASRPQKSMLTTRSPGDFELLGYKTEATRTSEALEKIIKLLEEKA